MCVLFTGTLGRQDEQRLRRKDTGSSHRDTTEGGGQQLTTPALAGLQSLKYLIVQSPESMTGSVCVSMQGVYPRESLRKAQHARSQQACWRDKERAWTALWLLPESLDPVYRSSEKERTRESDREGGRGKGERNGGRERT